jgi:replication-associated recombination protein RarA
MTTTPRLTTIRGHALSEVASALQKAIRRGDPRLAGYFAIEMFESNYAAYAWRRLLTISAEDCAGVITQEVKALYDSWAIIHGAQKGKGRIFLAKAVILLCQSRKSRDADHLTNLVYDPQALDDAAVEAFIVDARQHPEPIPEYAYDVHTRVGKQRGKTRTDFFLDEHDALSPRVPGLFDTDLEKLRGDTANPRRVPSVSPGKTR